MKLFSAATALNYLAGEGCEYADPCSRLHQEDRRQFSSVDPMDQTTTNSILSWKNMITRTNPFRRCVENVQCRIACTEWGNDRHGNAPDIIENRVASSVVARAPIRT